MAGAGGMLMPDVGAVPVPGGREKGLGRAAATGASGCGAGAAGNGAGGGITAAASIPVAIAGAAGGRPNGGVVDLLSGVGAVICFPGDNSGGRGIPIWSSSALSVNGV